MKMQSPKKLFHMRKSTPLFCALLLSLSARRAWIEIEPLPGGTYAFCYDVLDLWGAKPVNKESETNLVFMLSSVFAAGMEYAHREGGTANADRNV